MSWLLSEDEIWITGVPNQYPCEDISVLLCVILTTQLHHQLEQNGDVGELQGRVRDLQDKLRKQKQQTREYEEALRHGGGAARKPGETQSAVEASSQIDSKVRPVVVFTGAMKTLWSFHMPLQ